MDLQKGWDFQDRNGKKYFAVGNFIQRIPSGLYTSNQTMYGQYFLTEQTLVDDPLIKTDTIIELEKMFVAFVSSDFYTEANMVRKLLILLYGEPGCGKSSVILYLSRLMISLGGICISVSDAEDMENGYNAIRDQDKDRFILLIFEDVDRVVSYSDTESSVSNILDGRHSLHNTIFIATTNYISKLPPRLLRPGRFSEIVEVTPPSQENKIEAVRSIFDGIDDEELARLAALLDGMDISSVRDTLADVIVFKKSDEEISRALANRRKLIAASKLQQEKNEDN